MKQILITGANSYIGTAFEAYLAQWPEAYRVDTVDMTGSAWREKSFAGYDAVYHVAGLAHADTGKITQARKALYDRVNRDLAVETARKAKTEGVTQFIFMSSALVYGDSAPIGKRKVITKDTPASPANFYGDSKWQAEKGLLPLNSEGFRVVILRAPMVYGKGCKGNYPALSRLARKMPFFPAVENQRSMLYIGNLVEFVRLMIENEEQGIFWPQNEAYVNTAQLVGWIAAAHGKRLLLVRGAGWLLKRMSRVSGLVNKAFGSLSFELEMSEYKQPYRRTGFEQSIMETEGKCEACGPAEKNGEWEVRV